MVEVKDILFEALYKRYAFEFRAKYVRKVIKAKTPELHDQLSELNKKLREAREKRDYDAIGKLTAKIAELKEKIAEATPKEHEVLERLKAEKREIDKSMRKFFAAIISRDEIVVPVEEALAEGKPELALRILAGAAGGEGARGARYMRPREVDKNGLACYVWSVRNSHFGGREKRTHSGMPTFSKLPREDSSRHGFRQ